MNRVLKFRAWDNGTMKRFIRIPFYVDCDGNTYKDNDPHGIDMSGKRSISPLINCVLMQYTGCNDKHGNPIFEGDVVKYTLPGETSEDATMEYIEEVSFIDSCFCVDGYVPVSATTDWNVEVIGDIYRNPDLLATKPETKD